VLGEDPDELNQLTEEAGSVLDGVTFVLFGAVLLGPALGDLRWSLVVYAVLSLTVVRMIPVAIAMWGTHALRRWDSSAGSVLAASPRSSSR
jgi:NhaP-type Na+/H+ or K+/H+ antiporter